MAVVRLNGVEQRVGNIFCIGRNYAAHVAELGNQLEEEPLVFLKPSSALTLGGQAISLPAYSADVHHECELVLLVGRGGRDIAEADALSHIAAYGIGLDLTARDVQSEAKQHGKPWTKAKGFRHAACVSDFVAAEAVDAGKPFTFSLQVNGVIRQRGDTSLMLFPLATIISYLSQVYGLTDGDLIYTGTPQGVAALQPGDVVQAQLDGLVTADWTVSA
ncbi:isomerase/hydrolase [Aquitalea sp. FJL05]|uniref:fumarylacetoacetate hydrolase family protein n=1 Tax=Aquitalea TaxID=407217 RepID=UPI000F5B3E2B|nr:MULTISPECIES: fumarylacetoacetate hydrolase family protein [Aquitalea]RQO73035.1 isomerase/hydrolase [Aquitalea sp. FJL05]